MGKGENAGKQFFSPFLSLFSMLYCMCGKRTKQYFEGCLVELSDSVN